MVHLNAFLTPQSFYATVQSSLGWGIANHKHFSARWFSVSHAWKGHHLS